MFGWFKKKENAPKFQLHFNEAKLEQDVLDVQTRSQGAGGLRPENYTGVMEVFNSSGDLVKVTDIVAANDQRLASGELNEDTLVGEVTGRPVIFRNKYGGLQI
jgi:hypothetical protein